MQKECRYVVDKTWERLSTMREPLRFHAGGPDFGVAPDSSRGIQTNEVLVFERSSVGAGTT